VTTVTFGSGLGFGFAVVSVPQAPRESVAGKTQAATRATDNVAFTVRFEKSFDMVTSDRLSELFDE
jgi:hypothetical protein